MINVFFLLTFPLVGLAAYLVLRRLTLSPNVAIVCSILYALLPYHFLRGEGHLLLSAYYAVPLGAWLVLSVLADRPLFGTRRAALVDGRAVRGDRVRLCLVLLLRVHRGARRVCCGAARGGDAELAAARARGSGRRRDRCVVPAHARALLRLLGRERDESGRRAPDYVRVRGVRAEVRAARAADRASPDRCARAAPERSTTPGFRGPRRRWTRRLGSSRRSASSGCSACAFCSSCLPVAGSLLRWRECGSRGPACAAVRVGRRALDLRGGGRPADPVLEPALGLHRVLRACSRSGSCSIVLLAGCGRGGGARCSGPGSSSPC